MKATLRNYRQSSRKVRLVADLIRGKNAEKALTDLKFIGKRAAEPIAKVLRSALANAKENDSLSDSERENLYVKEVRVDEGFTIKRFMPKAHGRATPIHKRTSHIALTLEARTPNVVEKKKTTPVKMVKKSKTK